MLGNGMGPWAWLILALWLALPPSASALCDYNGVENARTTISQEFRDAKWVAKVRVLSGQDNWLDDKYQPWTIYRLKVLEIYKGRPQPVLRFFTYRNSAGYYFDSGADGADIGSDYLVFLNPQTRHAGEPAEVIGTVFVNYACGQSKPWDEVTQTERADLTALSRKREK